MEDGVPFCPQCGAPQIRVTMQPGPAVAATPSLPPDQAPPRRLSLAELQPASWSRAWRAANLAAGLGALTALLVAVITGLPQLGFLIWMVGGGSLAVVIYRRRQHLERVTARMGARLGAMAGL
ncbi:MAG TPA: hypothetical protein VKT29_08380, partial [Terriglobales bacterium]|nr:hypothetical protein [Terriglobales bacterium]